MAYNRPSFASSPPGLANPLSRPSMGGMPPVDPMTHARAAELRKEFAQLDADQSGFVSLDEIIAFFNKKNPNSADPGLCGDLFRRMDKNYDSRVTVEEFISAYVERENDLKKGVTALEAEVVEKQKQKAQAQASLREAQGTERANAWGIMEKSQLTVQVYEARDLEAMDINGKSDPYVILTCEKQQIETKVVWNELNPVWNEAFTFNIVQGNGELLVTVMDKDTLSKDDFLGQVSIPLAELRDQMKHDNWYDLQGNKPGLKAKGKIHLGLQWIHSRVLYLETVVRQWDEAILADQKELGLLKEELDKLKAPFSNLTASRLWDSTTTTAVERKFSEAVENFAIATLKITNWQKFSSILLLAYFVIATFAMYYRPDFMNLSLAAFAFYNFCGNKWVPAAYLFIVVGIPITFLLDIAWLAVYTEQWSASGGGLFKDNSSTSTNEDGVRRFALACAFINFFLKVVLWPVVFKNYADLKSNRQFGAPMLANAQNPLATANYPRGSQPMGPNGALSPPVGMGMGMGMGMGGRPSVAGGYDMRGIPGAR